MEFILIPISFLLVIALICYLVYLLFQEKIDYLIKDIKYLFERKKK